MTESMTSASVPFDDFHEALRLLRIPIEHNGAYLVSAAWADGVIKAEYAKVLRVSAPELRDPPDIETNGHAQDPIAPEFCVCGEPWGPHRTNLKVI